MVEETHKMICTVKLMTTVAFSLSTSSQQRASDWIISVCGELMQVGAGSCTPADPYGKKVKKNLPSSPVKKKMTPNQLTFNINCFLYFLSVYPHFLA